MSFLILETSVYAYKGIIARTDGDLCGQVLCWRLRMYSFTLKTMKQMFLLSPFSKWRDWGVKYAFQSHVSSKIQSQDSNPGSQTPQSPLKVTLPYRPLSVCVYTYILTMVWKGKLIGKKLKLLVCWSFSAEDTLTSGCPTTEHAENSFQGEVSEFGLSHWTTDHSKGAQWLLESGGS